jgi:hypothetical protein
VLRSLSSTWPTESLVVSAMVKSPIFANVSTSACGSLAHACVVVRLIGTASLSHPPCTTDDCANPGTAPGVSGYRTNDRAARCATCCPRCRGCRTSSIASISVATFRFCLGYRAVRRNNRRDDDNKKDTHPHQNLPTLLDYGSCEMEDMMAPDVLIQVKIALVFLAI